MPEPEYVEDCPYCDVEFIGASPDEVRDHVEDEHTPIGRLLVFGGPEDE